MADSDQSSEDRTLEPSARRLEKARSEGQVPRSRDLSHLMILGTAALGFSLLGSSFADSCRHILTRGLTFDLASATEPSRMGGRLAELALDGVRAALPMLAAMMAASLAAPLLIGGWNFALDTVAPRFERLDPIQGIQRLFSLSSLVDLGKVLLVAVLLSLVGASFIMGHMEQLQDLALQSLPSAAAQLTTILMSAFTVMAATLAVTAAIDVPWQMFRYRDRMMMTFQEAKQEDKEMQGDPRLRQRVRSAAREMARKRMMAAVPSADVVITNPTHFAVALKYSESMNRAPRVVAKGMDELAARIRELAAENGVPQLEAPPLARALYRHVEIGAEIPAALYTAVAQVLAYVYQLRRYRDGEGARPTEPRDIEVPDGFDPFAPRATA
jgi:flagellar biosynthetic protein FlhB